MRRRVFGISPDAASFTTRGFAPPAPHIRRRLESAGKTFVLGYNTALESTGLDDLADRLTDVDLLFRGFAYEGAAMALALFDTLTPWNRGRLQAFLDGHGHDHIYMVHIGAGWAMARLHRNFDRATRHSDPLLRWLAADGIGFHEGFFHPDRTIDRQQVPGTLTGYARRAFDMGLGRSLWFVRGGDPAGVAATIATFNPVRHGELWTGIGLACTYAGGVHAETIHAVAAAGRRHAADMAQGAAFAAKARLRAGNPAPHTEMACGILCDSTADVAAAVTDDALEGLPADGDLPSFEVWRQRIRANYV
ncbi:MAG: hypothetical protein CMJ18_13045 [Phycisphaeraceae bacterium]|nr:hypothetical protein [Phycisphaeraceae bacterium]